MSQSYSHSQKSAISDFSEKLALQAYLVVAGSFVVNLIVEGSYSVWNVIFNVFVEEFQTTKARAAWTGSILQASPSLFGPLTSALIHRYGCRKATIAGSLIACFGWFLGAFAKNVVTLTFTFGFIGGLGLSLTYIPSMFIVAYYFRKRVSLASSIAVAGSGLGVFVFAPLTVFLMEEYTWKGTIIICSALFLHIIPCGMLFVVPEEEFKSKENPQNDDTRGASISNLTESIPENAIIYKRKDTFLRSKISLNPSPVYALTQIIKKSSINETSKIEKMISFGIQKENNEERPRTLSDLSNTSTLVETAYLLRLNGFWSHRAADYFETLAAHVEEKCSNVKSANENRFYVDFSVLKNRVFGRLCFQSFLVFLAYDTPLMMIVGFAESKGISQRDAALLLSVYGVFNTFGQILLGWLADLNYIKKLSLYSSTTVVAGLATVMVAGATSYRALMVYCAVYGVFISSNFSLSTVIIIENLGLSSLNDAFGISSMVEGLAILVGPPIGGYLSDLTGDYVLTFVCAGVTITSSVFIFYVDDIVSPCLFIWRCCGHKKVSPMELDA